MKAFSAGSACLFAFAAIGLLAAPAMATTENTVIGIDLGTTVRASKSICARIVAMR